MSRNPVRVALATCADVPDLDEDGPALLGALARLGVEAVPTVWDSEVDWQRFGLVVVRSTWDYAERRDAFLAWAGSLPRVLNQVPVLRWSTDKELYLADLGRAGVATVPTRFVEPGGRFETPDGPFVVKPAVSAGGRRSGRFDSGDHEAAARLVGQIHGEGVTAMVQPYLGPPDRLAEKGLVFIDGSYSHALLRSVPLPPPGHPAAPLYLEESLGPADVSPADRALAERALAAVPFSGTLLYARVDVVRGLDGAPLVLELELAEPSLYLAFGPGSAERFAGAIVRAATARSA